MSLQQYNLSWSDSLIQRVETHLRDIHSAIIQYYERNGYETVIDAARSATTAGEEETAAPAAAVTPIDAVSPAGSFLLRTCVHDTPFPELHAQRGVGADLVLSIPAARCSAADLQEGLYLERRQAFLEEIERYLQQIIEGAQKRTSIAATNEHSDDEDEEGEEHHKDGKRHSKKVNAAAAARLGRMEVSVVPMHGCYALGEKQTLRLRFRRRPVALTPSCDASSSVFETVYVQLHFRPAVFSGRTVNAAAVRKHPYYSYCILEDYLMPQYLKRLHEVCVASANVRRAVVVLKAWAHHTGLMSAASGHPEGLNGFVTSAMVLRLLEEGIITAGMSLDNTIRAVWVQLSRGFFLSTGGGGLGNRPGKIPAAEEQGEVAVLRLSGDVHNILFHTPASFFANVVRPAAEAALQHPFAVEVVDRIAFLPLALRHDVALTVRLHAESKEKGPSPIDRSPAAVRKSGQWRAPRVEAMAALRQVLVEALGVRATSMTAWPTDDDHLQVLVQLTSETEGRNRLTRGPAIEDTAAVDRFNTFWGAGMTSTRQFSDGAIYRCVLWTFPEDAGTHTTIAISASSVLRRVVEYALRTHVAKSAEVAVLLGGLDGFLAERIGAEWRDAAPLMQRSLLDAANAVQFMLQSLPHNSVPCRIVSFDVVAASERHTEVFPVRPHLALTYTSDDLQDVAFAGLSTAPTMEPIHCVLSIDDNHKIPDTMEAIAMMKGAIAAQLAKTLQTHFGEAAGAKKNDSGSKSNISRAAHASEVDRAIVQSPIRTQCTSQSFDIIYRGYLFRVYIAHYREVSLLRALQRQTEANVLEMKLYWTAQHAKFLRTIAFGHHSYSHAVRLAKRWMSAMGLYEFVQPEAVELLVANAYLQPVNIPKTPAGGFLCFVQLLATHDWTTPLVLPFTDDDSDKTAVAAAALVRKVGEQQGMFIATPYAPAASPFTALTPRPMIVSRLVQLAQSVVAVLLRHLEGHNSTSAEVEAFTSNPRAFDFAVRFHPRLVLQPDRALRIRTAEASATNDEGLSGAGVSVDDDTSVVAASGASSPEAATSLVRIWQLDELDAVTSSREYINQLVEREPAAHAVRVVRAALRERGMMFYDALAPSTLHVVGITAERQLSKSEQLHYALIQVARGALLPAPSSAFVASDASTNHAADHHCEDPHCGQAHGQQKGGKGSASKNKKRAGSSPATSARSKNNKQQQQQRSRSQSSEKDGKGKNASVAKAPREDVAQKRSRSVQDGAVAKVAKTVASISATEGNGKPPAPRKTSKVAKQSSK